MTKLAALDRWVDATWYRIWVLRAATVVLVVLFELALILVKGGSL